MVEQVVSCKIHPAIGIARVGNSSDRYFIGPELVGRFDPPRGGYKDAGDPINRISPRVKRQAARFRIFGYDADGRLLREITTEDASISWNVHLINKKGAAHKFAGTDGEHGPPQAKLRNADIVDRDSLIIDPGTQTIDGPDQSDVLMDGQFMGIPVSLGELRTDEQGRLLVLGGSGTSGTKDPSRRITNYANNDRWYDDVGDGPVTATVVLSEGRTLTAAPAWVIVGPPDFAPAMTNLVTLYDIAYQAAVEREWLTLPERPSFTQDIYPLLARAVSLQWVQERALIGHGPQAGGPGDFQVRLTLLASNSADPEVRDARNGVFSRVRDPNAVGQAATKQASSRYMPILSGDRGDAQPGKPGTWLTFTKAQYELLCRWAEGNFDADWQGEPVPVRAVNPSGLDRASLEACSGGPFFPGMEAGWPMRNPALYAEPFRLSHDHLQPGDITARMAVPWQADFFECREHWWPSVRPDEVLTAEALTRVKQLDLEMQKLNPSSEEYTRCAAERAALWQHRVPWARGLPPDSPAGDNAMVTEWSQLGFVVNKAEDGSPLLIDGLPQFVETERERFAGLTMPEYFHLLVNIEQHPDFRPRARDLAYAFFQRYLSPEYELIEQPELESLHFFEYTPAAFDRRLDEIYRELAKGMNQPHWYDTGFSLDGTHTGRFSDRAVKEGIRQRAPFNLTDGAWLQNMAASGPISDIHAMLFEIWVDEAGNGTTEMNHANVYETLLRSLNIYLPPLKSPAFIAPEQGFLPSAFESPVFQMAVGLFPVEFLPELIGMSLYLEWESTPSMGPIVSTLRGRQINAHFFSLHVAIDNIINGHGAIAKRSAQAYLEDVRRSGGERAVQEHWRRIWNGYATWATLGTFGSDLVQLLVEIDGKLTPDDRKQYLERRMHDLIARMAPAASLAHGGKTLGITGKRINQLFGDPPAFLRMLADPANGYVDPRRPRESHFFELLDFGGPMYKVFTDEDQALVLDWIESLDPVTGPPPIEDIGREMASLVVAKGRQGGSSLHNTKTLPDPMGAPRLINDWFNDPIGLMQALVDGRLVVPGSVGGSRFLSLIQPPAGPMGRFFSDQERSLVARWIEAGAPPPRVPPLRMLQSLATRPSATDAWAIDGRAARAIALEAEAAASSGEEVRTASVFEQRRFFGMGSVH